MKPTKKKRSRLSSDMLKAALEHSNKTAVISDNRELSYQEILDFSTEFSAFAEREHIDRIAVIVDKTVSIYAVIFAALISDVTYLPLDPNWPRARLAHCLRAARVSDVVYDRAVARDSAELAQLCSQIGVRIVSAQVFGSGPRFQISSITNCGKKDPSQSVDQTSAIRQVNIAYVLFTSGSTGAPKGVMVTPDNLSAFYDGFVTCYRFSQSDIIAQIAPLSFDLSIADLIPAWVTGAALIAVNEVSALLLERVILKYQCTVVALVPTLADRISKRWRANGLVSRSLRMVSFCGEPLTRETAAQWRQLAPDAMIWNLYGPTEATCAVSALDVTNPYPDDPEVLPIGRPWREMRFEIDQTQELLLHGPQVALGYIQENVFQGFVCAADGARYYRTGDFVREVWRGMPILGPRQDTEVKIGGKRINLAEIENAIEDRVPGVRIKVIVVRPENSGKASEALPFLRCWVIADKDCLAEVRIVALTYLPDYMRPREIVGTRVLPTNPNGKIDLAQLAEPNLAHLPGSIRIKKV